MTRLLSSILYNKLFKPQPVVIISLRTFKLKTYGRFYPLVHESIYLGDQVDAP
jgi:hypothetical protein